ncbi:MAG: hypothetical protein M1825_006231 [Sarcosagium campestre]|nr:MAG: hypothetical protein M1825_006231 [Sarcosagium campestre]
MAPLTVLSDGDVRTLLYSLTTNDIINIQVNLAEALHTYSTGTQEESACSINQPERVALTVEGGATTLFMPASTGDVTGIKTVTISEACARAKGLLKGGSNNSSSSIPASFSPSTPSTPSAYSSPSTSSVPSISSAFPIRSASSSSAKSSSTHTTDSSRSPTGSGAQTPAAGISSSSSTSLTQVSSVSSTQSTTPRGTLTILSNLGSPIGILAAEELTAFRTALSATLLLKKREHVHTITVFGAGKQAYWHIRLCLLLRGPDIHRINIVNRGFARAQALLGEIHASGLASTTKLTVLSSEYGEYARLLKEDVRKADVIFCCTPSTAPLFPAEHLTATEGRRKGRLVSAIGSYKPHMLELHPDVLRQAAAPHHAGHHFHKHAPSGGVVIVDSLTAALKEAGEVIQAGLGPKQLVELGELLMLKRQREKELSRHPTDLASPPLDKAGPGEWLAKGNVIYKSVGLGLMDLTVGLDLVRLANDRGVGTMIPDF